MLISVGGIRLNVIEEGSGRPVILLHGNGGEISNWEPQLEALSTNHRAIGIDLRGFGRSDATLGRIEIEDYATDVARIIDTLDLRDVVVIGISLGGMVAQHLALARPLRVAGLVIADSAAALDDTMRQLLASSADLALNQTLGEMAEAYKHALFSPATLQSPSRWVLGFLRQFAAGDPWQHYLANRAATRLDLLPKLPNVAVPALVVCGEHDQVCPPALSQQIADAIPDTELLILDDAAHVTNLEQPERFTEAVERFLDRV